MHKTYIGGKIGGVCGYTHGPKDRMEKPMAVSSSSGMASLLGLVLSPDALSPAPFYVNFLPTQFRSYLKSIPLLSFLRAVLGFCGEQIQHIKGD